MQGTSRRKLWGVCGIAAVAVAAALWSSTATPPRATPNPQPQAPAQPTASTRPPSQTVDRPLYPAPQEAAVDQALLALQTALAQAALGADHPWALALAVRGLGPTNSLNGKPLLGLLTETLKQELSLVDGSPQIDSKFEHSLPSAAWLSVLLESDLPLSQRVLPNYTLRDWLKREWKAATPARSDEQWTQRAWLLDALTLSLAHEGHGSSLRDQQAQLADFTTQAFEKLERESRIFSDWAGRGDSAVAEAQQELSPLMQQHQGLYALADQGLHLSQSALRSVALLQELGANEPGLELAARRLVGTLSVRHRFERDLWPKLGPHESVSVLGYCGALLEALAWGRSAIPGPSSAGPGWPYAEQSCAGEIVQHVNHSGAALNGSANAGVAEPDLARTRALSHAVRGLRMLRRTRWPASEPAPSLK